MKRVPDLYYVVVRSHTAFCRRGHLTVFYRHDKDGRKFIYHVEAHYGDNGRATRAEACSFGREIITRKRQLPWRNLKTRNENHAAIPAAGLDPDYAH
jgi:hypothetical protein